MSSPPDTPRTTDAYLCESIVIAVLGLVQANSPQRFAVALAQVVKAGEALWSHRV